MYTVNAISRETCETTVENYASFETYEEARSFADRYEMEARACGWTYVVREASNPADDDSEDETVKIETVWGGHEAEATEYSILVYDHRASDSERTWAGTDVREADAKLAEMSKRFPHASIRFSTHTYFKPAGVNA